jgi:hypothetical protein
MPQISRKYNFQPGTKALSQQVDEELDQLVDSHNSVDTRLTSAETNVSTMQTGKTDKTGDHPGTWQNKNYTDITTIFDLLSQKFDFMNPSNYLTSPNGTKFQIGVNDDGSLYSYNYDGVYSQWFNPISSNGGKWEIHIDDDGSVNTVKAN